MQFAESAKRAIDYLQRGVGFEVGDYSGAVEIDAVRESVTLNGKASSGYAVQRLGGGFGPTVDMRIGYREMEPGFEVDLVILNGEVVNQPLAELEGETWEFDGGRPTPHIEDQHFTIQAPPGMAVASRFPWIRVTRELDKNGVTVAARLYRVEMGYPLDQCGMWVAALAFVPHQLVEEHEVEDPVADVLVWPTPLLVSDLWGGASVPARRRTMPDRLERPRMTAVSEAKRAKVRAFIWTGDGISEESYNDADWGALTGGQFVRFDEFAEYDGLDDNELFLLCWRWNHEVLRRPQRGFLTRNGEPLRPTDVPSGFNMAIGPTEELWPNLAANVYGFERMTAAQRAVRKGSIDAQHGKRWWAPVRFLASQFGGWLATRVLGYYAAATRLDIPDPRHIGVGQLGRAHGWVAELQATDLMLNPLHPKDAMDWLSRFVETCERDQTKHGGLCAWTHNKEATDYGRQFVWSQMSEADRPPSWRDLPIEPVTRPEQEMILQWGLHCAARAGCALPDMLMDRLSNFIHGAARANGASGPWERATVDGRPRSSGITRFYSGTSIVLAKEYASKLGGGAWKSIADDYAGGDRLSIMNWGDSQLRNAWHLLALVEPF